MQLGTMMTAVHGACTSLLVCPGQHCPVLVVVVVAVVVAASLAGLPSINGEAMKEACKKQLDGTGACKLEMLA